MKVRKLKLQVGICSFLIAVAMVLGGVWWTSVKGTGENMVDLNKGITHEYVDDTDTKGYIYLNGNSVIIEEAASSTDTVPLCNIYIDINRNGVIDAGEEKATLGEEGVDMDATLPIYGIYKQSSTIPISITVKSGQYTTIYGINEGAVITEEAGEAACIINVQDGNIATLYASVDSRIETPAATAVEMKVTGGMIGNCTGVQGGQVTTTTGEQRAVAITVTGGMIQGTCKGIQGGEIITSDNTQTAFAIAVSGSANIKGAIYGIEGNAAITGNADFNIQPDINMSIGAVYGITNGVQVDGSATMNIDNITVGGLLFVYGSGSGSDSNRIEGNVSLTTGSNMYASMCNLLYYSSAGGDVTADLYGNMQEGATSGIQYYGVQNGNVEGNVNITYQDGLFGNVVGVQNANVKGDVDILYSEGIYIASCWGVMSSGVAGDVTITSGNMTKFKNLCDFQGCSAGVTIEGNVIIDIENTEASENSATFQGISIYYDGSYIAGNVDVKVHGGVWQIVNGISLSNKMECRGDCKVEISDIDKFNRINGIQGGVLKENAEVQIANCYAASSSDLYGINDSSIEKNVIVNIEHCNFSDKVYGMNQTQAAGTVNITIYDVQDPMYLYGIYNTNAGDDLTMTIDMCSAQNIHGMFCNRNEVTGDADVKIQNCSAQNSVYGISGLDKVNNITLTCSDNQVSEFHGIMSCTVLSEVFLSSLMNQIGSFKGIEDCTVSGNVVVENSRDISQSEDNNLYTAIERGSVSGDVTINTMDCQFAGYHGVYYTKCEGTVEVLIDGGTYNGITRQDVNIYPYYCPDTVVSGDEKREITVLLRNAKFTATDTNATICNNITKGFQLTMTIEDSCQVGDAYEVYPNKGYSGDSLLIYGDDYYYTGSYPITQDVIANNIFFGKEGTPLVTANLLIPEGVTMTAAGKIYLAKESNILIEGSLEGTQYESTDDTYTNGTMYINGGTVTDVNKVRRVYYPLTFSYPKKSGTIIPAESQSNIGTNSLRPELYFGFVGADVKVTCEAKKGYQLDKVTLTRDGEASEELTASSGDDYSFNMEACPVEIEAFFSGTPIVLGKEEDSLTTKLYEKTTKDAPLYDLTDIAITNDAEEGEVTYEIKEGSTLPKGLTLEDGKLFGTPAQALEDGKDVVITVTGCNDTTAEFTLHITVMAGDEEGNPVYEVPKDLTAVYGDTLGDVELPSDENGAFTWQQEETTPVGDVGEQEFLVTYTPTNDKYKTVTDIKVTVTVQKAKAEFTKVEELTAKHEDTLDDLTLPEVENGEYYWVTSAEVKPEDGEAYDLGFRPADAKNYDWEKIEGWDEQAGSVLMTVTIKIQHNYGTAWEKDEINHWHVCECGQIQEKVAHAWDEGIITKEATEEENGIKEYHCTVCEAVKEEVIPAIGHTHEFKEVWVSDEENHWHVCECGEVQGKTAHTWNAGVVMKEATEAENGSRQYTCTVCGKTREEVIKATGGTGNNPSQGSTGGNPPQQGTTEAPKPTEKQAASKGTILTDSATKAKYKVISSGNEEPAVQYVSSTDAAASAVTIASSVTIDGVAYKITEIADNAFKNNKKLKKVTIAGNIVTIGKSAFQGCSALTSVKLGSSVKTIKDKAFYGCKKLSTLTLGANVATLGKSVFEGCISLKKVTIPKKVTKIGSRAFYNCKKLVSITIKTTKLTTKNVGSKAFTKAGGSNYKKLKVKVPKSKLKTYKSLLKKKGLSAKARITK